MSKRPSKLMLAILIVSLAVSILAAIMLTVVTTFFPPALPVRVVKLCSFRLDADTPVISDFSVGPEGDPVITATNLKQEKSGEENHKNYLAQKRQGLIKCCIYHFKNGVCKKVDISDVPAASFMTQPLSSGEYLLSVSSGGDKNYTGYIYADGKMVRKLVLGFCFNDVQVALNGEIWVSCFDQGVFGDDRLGNSGLACFDKSGKPLFLYNSDKGSDIAPSIEDCYALNVASDDDVWLCPYTSFSLIHLRHRQVAQVLAKSPVAGSSAFAIFGHRALFAPPPFDFGGIKLADLKTGKIIHVRPVDESGRSIDFNSMKIVGRGSRLFLLGNDSVYAIDLKQIGNLQN